MMVHQIICDQCGKDCHREPFVVRLVAYRANGGRIPYEQSFDYCDPHCAAENIAHRLLYKETEKAVSNGD